MEFVVVGLIVLVIIVLVLAWMRLGLKRGAEGEAIMMLQKETEALRQELQNSITNHLSIVSQQLSSVTSHVSEQLRGVTSQLQTSTGQINERMDNAARVVGDVRQTLGKLGEATKQVYDVGKDIAGLQEILRAPTLRGGLGEFFLGDLLSQILPSSHYELQYTFKNGNRVDAVIKLAQGLVPVDSKFPLENFRRYIECQTEKDKLAAKRGFVKDVKNRIDEIASSYILPDEGTFNFALMYIPAENVYYETIIRDEDSFGDERHIAGYAFSKRVIPVSPNSFYAYLQTILLGLRGLEISKKAETILAHLETLRNDFQRFTDDFDVLGGHISKARTKHEDAQKRLERFGERLSGIAGVRGDGALDDEPEAAKKGLVS
ncbi:MAG: DNA recombination protein RmuC [Deltaproteobacteria bacterium]|nr:DNA recombination protein RmuC [Deltaproteobacteria bacterium]